MIVFDFNTPITAQDDLNILVADEQDDGFSLVVLHSSYEEPIIKRRNLLCKDRPWSESSLEDLVYDLIVYEVGNPKTKIPEQVFQELGLDPYSPDFSLGASL